MNIKFFCLIFLCAGISTVIAQNQFEGYSLVVEADESGVCPIRYLPAASDGTSIEVFVVGTNQQMPAAGLRGCGQSQARANAVFSNEFGKWCFQGTEKFYDIKLSNGIVYLWHALTEKSGVYNVKDFRPVTRTPAGIYNFQEPADYTRTIKNAVAFIAARQGGTLFFPDGDYTVGTTNGNTRDPQYEAITLPSGITIEGSSPNISVPVTNLPTRTSATRIRLRNENQTIFRIGGCTNRITVRNIELLGNSELYGESKRSPIGNYGIEAVGKWALNPEAPNSSQFFRFENVTIQNFDKGIYVRNAGGANCDGRTQLCHNWQFDYVRIDHGAFINNKTGIWLDTYNSSWKVTNTLFNYLAANAPGDGIRIRKAGSMLIEQSWGGGYNYTSHIGGTFIYVDTIAALTIINSGSERGQRSLYTNPLGSTSSMMITVVGGGFGDKVELHGRLSYVSTGNVYGAKTIEADPTVTITSTGDRFCLDPLVLPGFCVDENRRAVNDPGFGRGNVMFQTGRLPEGKGDSRINGRPNIFGYDVRINNGLLQHDPNITFSDITKWAAGGDGRPPISDGAIVYCKDCRTASGGQCSQGRAGADGAFAKRINRQWRCD